MPVLTRLYSEEVFGVFFVFSSSVAILTILTTLCYELSVILPDKDEDAANLLFLAIIVVFMMSGIIFLLLHMFTTSFIGVADNHQIVSWIPFIPLSCLMMGIFLLFSLWHNRFKKFSVPAHAKIIKSITTGTVQVTNGFFGFHNIGLIAGLLAGQLVGLIFLFISSFRQLIQFVKYLSFKKMIKLAYMYRNIPVFNTMLSLTNRLSVHMPVFLLTGFYNVAIASYYGLANRVITTPMGMIQNSLSEVLYREASETYNKREDLLKLIKNLYLKLFKVSIIPFILLGIFAPMVFNFIFGANWTEAGKYVSIMTPWLFLVFLNSPFSTMATILNRQKGLFIFNVTVMVARFFALAAGSWLFNDVYYSLVLFVIVGFVANIFLIYYYLYIAKNSNRDKD